MRHGEILLMLLKVRWRPGTHSTISYVVSNHLPKMRIVHRTLVPTSIASDEIFLAEMTTPDQSARFSRLLVYAKIASTGRLMKTLCSTCIVSNEICSL